MKSYTLHRYNNARLYRTVNNSMEASESELAICKIQFILIIVCATKFNKNYICVRIDDITSIIYSPIQKLLRIILIGIWNNGIVHISLNPTRFKC